MRYYSAVRPAIPHSSVGCSRVTHPFAGCPLLGPLDLHVLSTPPAFVLSQDQTLRCVIFPDRNRSDAPHNPHIVMVRCIRKARQIKTSTPKAVLARFHLVVTVYRVGETERLAFEPVDYTTLSAACQTLNLLRGHHRCQIDCGKRL